MKQLIQKLTETFSPSGYEDAIREVILAEIRPLADEIRVDALGNIIARKGEKAAKGQRVMVAAHMDEIGLIATHIDENGFVRFTTVGIPFARYLLGGRVRFVNGVQGVIGSERPDKRNEIPPADKLFIDVGASGKKDCPVKVGDVAAFERPFVEMGTRLVAKSLDDRVGVAVAIETLRRLKPSPNEVYFVFTAQEEVGVRGATVSAYGVDPEVGIAVDVTPAGDTPNPDPARYRSGERSGDQDQGLYDAIRPESGHMDGRHRSKKQDSHSARSVHRGQHRRTRHPAYSLWRAYWRAGHPLPLCTLALRDGRL